MNRSTAYHCFGKIVVHSHTRENLHIIRVSRGRKKESRSKGDAGVRARFERRCDGQHGWLYERVYAYYVHAFMFECVPAGESGSLGTSARKRALKFPLSGILANSDTCNKHTSPPPLSLPGSPCFLPSSLPTFPSLPPSLYHAHTKPTAKQPRSHRQTDTNTDSDKES